jgi:hypothetical protein
MPKSKQRLMKFATFIAFVSLGLVDEIALACTSSSCSDTIGVLYITDGNVYIQPTHGLSGLTNCTPVSGGYLSLPTTDTSYASYYAMLLSAKLTNQSITLRTNSGANCTIAYATVP